LELTNCTYAIAQSEGHHALNVFDAQSDHVTPTLVLGTLEAKKEESRSVGKAFQIGTDSKNKTGEKRGTGDKPGIRRSDGAEKDESLTVLQNWLQAFESAKVPEVRFFSHFYYLFYFIFSYLLFF
jgi:hypothetical protein